MTRTRVTWGREHLRRIEERLAGIPGLALAGNAYHRVRIADCIHSGEEVAERLLKSI